MDSITINDLDCITCENTLIGSVWCEGNILYDSVPPYFDELYCDEIYHVVDGVEFTRASSIYFRGVVFDDESGIDDITVNGISKDDFTPEDGWFESTAFDLYENEITNFTIIAKDKFGNTTTVEKQIVYDNILPEIEIEDLIDQNILYCQGKDASDYIDYTIKGTVSDNTGIYSIKYEDSFTGTTHSIDIEESNSVNEFHIDRQYYPTDYEEISFVAIDFAGNTSTLDITVICEPYYAKASRIAGVSLGLQPPRDIEEFVTYKFDAMYAIADCEEAINIMVEHYADDLEHLIDTQAFGDALNYLNYKCGLKCYLVHGGQLATEITGDVNDGVNDGCFYTDTENGLFMLNNTCYSDEIDFSNYGTITACATVKCDKTLATPIYHVLLLEDDTSYNGYTSMITFSEEGSDLIDSARIEKNNSHYLGFWLENSEDSSFGISYITLTRDNKPTISLDVELGDSYDSPSCVDNDTFVLSGTVIDDNSIDTFTINNESVAINDDNSWSYTLSLEKNVITKICIVAKDNMGNVCVYIRYICYGTYSSFAFYSSDDSSLNFIKTIEPISVGEYYQSKYIDAVYDGIETDEYEYYGDVPWSEYADRIRYVDTTLSSGIIKPISTAYWFSGFSECTHMCLDNLDTSQVVIMCDMFANCTSLTSIDVSHFDTSQVEDMMDLFYECSSLTSLDLSSFNTENVIEMYCIFDGCVSLETITFGEGWVWGSEGCLPIPNEDYIQGADGKWYNVETGESYEYDEIPEGVAATYTAIAVEKYVPYAIYCQSDESLTFVQSTRKIKEGSYYNGKYITGVFTGFDTEVYDMNFAIPPWLSLAENIKIVYCNDEIAPISTAYWFTNFKNCTTMDLTKLNTSNVSDMSYMFKDNYLLETLNINFDTSNTENMEAMFSGCYVLTLDCSDWDVDNVTNYKNFNELAPNIIAPTWKN